MERSNACTTLGVEKTEAMKYWKGYEYVIAEDFSIQATIYGYDLQDKFFHLYKTGRLEVFIGYAWDGNSGPFPDLKSTIEASCGHDILCDLVNSGRISHDEQPKIDQLYYDTAVRKGTWPWVARQLAMTIRFYMLKKGTKRYNRTIYEA